MPPYFSFQDFVFGTYIVRQSVTVSFVSTKLTIVGIALNKNPQVASSDCSHIYAPCVCRDPWAPPYVGPLGVSHWPEQHCQRFYQKHFGSLKLPLP